MRTELTANENPLMLDYFDQIYIINLVTRPDRLREIQQQLGKIGIDFTHPKINIFQTTKPTFNEEWPTIGTKGCFFSHLSVIQDAKQKQYERILILEDDVNFIEDFNTEIKHVIAQLKSVDWDIFYGGYRVSEETKLSINYHQKLNKSVQHALYLAPSNTDVLCCHFVALNKITINSLADYLQKMLKRPYGDAAGGPMHVDGAYCWFRKQHPQVKTYLAYPMLGYQRSSRTDIHDLKWFDMMPIVKTATDTVRKIKNLYMKC